MKTKSVRVVKLLGDTLKKMYPNFDKNQAILLTDLLEWDLWPGFIKIYGNNCMYAIVILYYYCWHSCYYKQRSIFIPFYP